MGVFDDKKFDQLDWISQATEPIDSKLNEVLGAIPESIPLDFDLFLEICSSGYSVNASIDSFISHAISTYAKEDDLSWDMRNAIKRMFEFQVTGSPVVDFKQKVIRDGTITIVKLASTMDEKVLESLLGKEGIAQFSTFFIHSDGLSRANEVMEILSKCEEGLRSRSERKKRHAISGRLKEMFKTNEWNIKDTELANKVGFWIKDYIVTGNIAAFSNFCKLKVMTHKGQAIYSMEESV